MEREKPNIIKDLMTRPFQQGSIIEIFYPNRITRLLGTFIILGSESFFYGKEVKLVARDRERSEIKIILERDGELSCATYRLDKTKVRFLHAPKRKHR